MSNDSIIVYGPKGCGKTHNVNKLAKQFGCDRVIDGFNPSRERRPCKQYRDDEGNTYKRIPRKCLILTNMELSEIHEHTDREKWRGKIMEFTGTPKSYR